MKMLHIKWPLTAVLWNILWLFVAYSITRVAFFLENYHYYDHILSSGKAWSLFWAGVYFDASGICYTNILWLLLMLLPLHIKETTGFQQFCKWLFMIVNGLGLAVNLCDVVYFQFTLRRTTTAIFSEFGGDEKIGSIIGAEFLNHWYLVLLFIALMAMLWWLYRKPTTRVGISTTPKRYYLVQTASLLLGGFLCWAGIRGGVYDVRPIKISTANQYIIRPNDAALILNTPFSLLRTIGKDVFHNPAYYKDSQEMARVYSPIHQPKAQGNIRRKNVVIILLESFGREYLGSLNQGLIPNYQGYTVFLDSLVSQSVTFRHSFANGHSSIDAMPSTLSGLPMFVQSYVTTTRAMNKLSGLADCLGEEGYETAFFHGATASSLGFQGFTKSTGFKHCYSMEDYLADKRTLGEAAYDQWWGIWDEPFLQYFSMKMTDMRQPFLATLFTLTSHHPFHVPPQYREIYKEEEMEIHKTIRYTDNALRQFFNTAKKQPWFNNTLFVLTGDHTNMSNHDIYKSDIGGFCSPIIIYDPSGELQPGMREGIAQQTDIMPTVLGYLGYSKPFLSFGCDLLTTPAEDTWAVNYLNGVYQYVKYGYVMQFNGERVTGIYSLDDRVMSHNLIGKVPKQAQMERELKAMIQQYMVRMIENKLNVSKQD